LTLKTTIEARLRTMPRPLIVLDSVEQVVEDAAPLIAGWSAAAPERHQHRDRSGEETEDGPDASCVHDYCPAIALQLDPLSSVQAASYAATRMSLGLSVVMAG
jgi:hypothetical protein